VGLRRSGVAAAAVRSMVLPVYGLGESSCLNTASSGSLPVVR
jgi:hypothetical protein